MPERVPAGRVVFGNIEVLLDLSTGKVQIQIFSLELSKFDGWESHHIRLELRQNVFIWALVLADDPLIAFALDEMGEDMILILVDFFQDLIFFEIWLLFWFYVFFLFKFLISEILMHKILDITLGKSVILSVI